MTDSPVIRVVQDPALDGTTNMARDEMLLTRVGARESPPTLRLYQWAPPTISLGYFQRYADYAALPPPAGTLPVVRRLSGGGAILHDLELTYSLALPLDHPLLCQGPNRLYELVHDVIIACLEDMQTHAHRSGGTDDSGPTRGPFFCFARRHRFDVLIGDAKVAGSAQRRTHHALLQHGSIMLGARCGQQPVGAPGLPYEQAIGSLLDNIGAQMHEVMGASVKAGEWSPEELATARALHSKYAGVQWTRRL